MKITSNAAIMACLAYAGIVSGDVLRVNVSLAGGLYEIDMNTYYQHYDFYVDAQTAEVLGFNSEPEFDDSLVEQTYHVEAQYAA